MAAASKPSSRSRVRVVPVTAEQWSDFAALFQSRGAPHYCWCTPYRFRDAHHKGSSEKQQDMQRLVKGGTPIGVLAYEGDEPVGWCSVAPRESYVKLEHSRTMPRVSADPTWTVLCFFIVREHRGQGISVALLKGAVEYARAGGARIIEGYPFDSAGISSTHRGASSVFRSAGFEADGARWFRALTRKRSAK